MQYPNFILIGAPKCGTASLTDYLSQHSQVFMADPTEPHYFSFISDGKPEWGVKSSEEYQKLFENVGNGQLAGETSTWYLFGNNTARVIKKELPGVKLLIVLREPAERAYSSFWYNRWYKYEDLATFEEALEAEEVRRQSQESLWDFQYLKAGLYVAQLKRYFQEFDRAQMRIILYDDLREDIHKTMTDIFTFLEINPLEQVDASTRQNKGVRMRFESLRFNKITDSIKKMWPEDLREYPRKILDFLTFAKPPKLKCSTRERLLQYYSQEILELEFLIGRDLSSWKKV